MLSLFKNFLSLCSSIDWEPKIPCFVSFSSWPCESEPQEVNMSFLSTIFKKFSVSSGVLRPYIPSIPSKSRWSTSSTCSFFKSTGCAKITRALYFLNNLIPSSVSNLFAGT